MIIFEDCQKLMKVFGLYTDDRRSYRIYGYAMYLLVFLPLVPIAFYIFDNFDDFAKVSPTMTIESCVISAVFKGTAIMLQRDRLKSLLITMQANIDEIHPKRMHHIVAMNRMGNLLTRTCLAIITACAFALFVAPLALVAIHGLNGTLNDEMWILPTPMKCDKLQVPIIIYKVFCFFVPRLPYDEFRSPMYGITYVVSAIAIYSAASILVVTCATFLCMASHLSACVLTVNDMIEEIDSLIGRLSSFNAVRDFSLQQRIKARLVTCFQAHNKIIKLIDSMQGMFGSIIFTQYFFSIAQLCVVVFIIQSVTATFDRQLGNLIMGIGYLMELFLYCYFGNELATNMELLAASAYQTRWYCFSPEIRFGIWLLIAGNQKSRFITGFGPIKASINTFLSVLNMIGSLLTFLRAVV